MICDRYANLQEHTVGRNKKLFFSSLSTVYIPSKAFSRTPRRILSVGRFPVCFQKQILRRKSPYKGVLSAAPALRLFPLLRGPCDGTIRVLSLSKRLTAVLPHLEGPASGADWRCFHSFPCSTERRPSDVKRSTRSHTCAIYFRSWDMLIIAPPYAWRILRITGLDSGEKFRVGSSINCSPTLWKPCYDWS